MSNGFDLSTLESSDTTTIEIMHPVTGDPIGVTATIYGQDSDVFRAESRKAESKYTEYARRNGGKPMPPADREQLDKRKAIACVKSIDGLSDKGEPLTDVSDILSRIPWIYEQVAAAIMDRSNFIKG